MLTCQHLKCEAVALYSTDLRCEAVALYPTGVKCGAVGLYPTKRESVALYPTDLTFLYCSNKFCIQMK